MKIDLSSLSALIALSVAVAAVPCTDTASTTAVARPRGSGGPSSGFGTAPTSASSATSSDSSETSSADSSSDPTTSADAGASVTASSNSTAATGAVNSAAAGGSSVLDAPQTIAAGESFDGAGATFDRGVDCTGQAEGGDSDAVFILEAGASISNVVIGPNQIEGIHCFGGCSLTNVVWTAVCEDAFTIKEQDAGDTTTITGGSATGADDKVLQHNGGGSLSVSGFEADTFGKVYRSCGNCDTQVERHVTIDDLTANDGSLLCGKYYMSGVHRSMY